MAELLPIRLEKAGFAPGGRPVLHDVDLTIGHEGITVLLGPNGAGKSVLLRMLAGLLPPGAGRASWAGAPQPGARVAMMFQQPMMLRASVAENVALGLVPMGVARAERRARAMAVLDRVGLAHRAGDAARHLSGGERQRLALARAWAMQARLVLLDEPTAALDPSAVEAVERIIREIRTEGAKIVMTTHNLGQAMRVADDIVFVAGGCIGEHSPASRFFSQPRSAEARRFIQGELPWQIAFED
jgi:tungstate transport system ATP-binding protein